MRLVDFTLACDIMMDLEGSIRPAIYLARELNRKGHEVHMMSPSMSNDVEDELAASGVTPINLHARLAARKSGLSALWFETWSREAFLRLNSKHLPNHSSITINFSQVISIPSSVWYLQGPPSLALRDMRKELSTGFRIVYQLFKPVIEYADSRLVSQMGKISSMIIANSKFCASMYSGFGIRVNDVIYPPIDCKEFHPSTSNPSQDYVLTYFGKETDFSTVKRVADAGVKIKAFGSKTPYIEKNLARHKDIECLGKVSTKELVNLYSNALYTLFPFTHEPFGYIPLESMACGTPALTYNLQGPSEYVTNNNSGWLANDGDSLVKKASELWENGYPPNIRTNCVREAAKFSKRHYLEKWLAKLSSMNLELEGRKRVCKRPSISRTANDFAVNIPSGIEESLQEP